MQHKFEELFLKSTNRNLKYKDFNSIGLSRNQYLEYKRFCQILWAYAVTYPVFPKKIKCDKECETLENCFKVTFQELLKWIEQITGGNYTPKFRIEGFLKHGAFTYSDLGNYISRYQLLGFREDLDLFQMKLGPFLYSSEEECSLCIEKFIAKAITGDDIVRKMLKARENKSDYISSRVKVRNKCEYFVSGNCLLYTKKCLLFECLDYADGKQWSIRYLPTDENTVGFSDIISVLNLTDNISLKIAMPEYHLQKDIRPIEKSIIYKKTGQEASINSISYRITAIEKGKKVSFPKRRNPAVLVENIEDVLRRSVALKINELHERLALVDWPEQDAPKDPDDSSFKAWIQQYSKALVETVEIEEMLHELDES